MAVPIPARTVARGGEGDEKTTGIGDRGRETGEARPETGPPTTRLLRRHRLLLRLVLLRLFLLLLLLHLRPDGVALDVAVLLEPLLEVLHRRDQRLVLVGLRLLARPLEGLDHRALDRVPHGLLGLLFLRLAARGGRLRTDERDQRLLDEEVALRALEHVLPLVVSELDDG